ncbi:MAG: DMSO reductase [Betaproteobacteria bacterium]|nr:MAG: DMSO reductase [Betaproteobacteria bacterium]
MKPAVSIIFSTVSSGAGLGLLALVALCDTFVLVAAGLASSVLHLANPKNAWRSFSRFKSSWLSREAVFAAALFPVSGLYIVLVIQSKGGASRILLAVLTCALAWAVLICTAMIYASLKPIRQWHTRWTPVNYVLLGHWSGALLLWAIACAYAARSGPFLFVAGVFGLAALAAKLAYWHAIEDSTQALTLERAIGVREGARGPGPISAAHARLLDVGHSHGTFLTSEFGFRLARRHARGLRGVALALGFGLPLAWLVVGVPRWQPALAAAVCCIMGLLVERWLFFAEAKHTVRLYHGDPRT